MRGSLLLFLLGGWLTGSVLMWAVATQNFRTVDRVLAESRPELSERIAGIGRQNARLVLRLLASELNRFYFRAWGIAQLVLGGACLVLILSSPRLAPKAGTFAGLMWGLTAALFFFITPRLINVGRQIDFVARTQPPPQVTTFWRLHLAYTVADGIKVALGIWLLARLIKNPEKGVRFRSQ
jgi:hypothetical protein